MGNWSPYSEEWEKQHLKKIMNETEPARVEFEKKPWIYKAIVRLLGTISYYWSLLVLRIRKIFDREYRQEVKQATNELEEKILRSAVDMVNDEPKDHNE